MGLFALKRIPGGNGSSSTGELPGWRRAAEAGHTFVFGLSDGRVIDGSRGGNSARFMNHA